MTLQVSNINTSGNVTINDTTYSNGGSLSFNNTVTITSNNYWIKSFSNAKRTIKSIAYGNGLFVAVSSTNSYIETSSDGYVWTNRTSANTSTSASVITYGNGVFVIGGTTGAVQSSTDGINWTNRTRANTNNIYAITYANGLFVGVGAGGSIVTSTDGTTWTNRTTANTSVMNGVAFGNGIYVAVGVSGATQYSSNGINWTNATRANTNGLNAITYGNDKFVAGGGNGAIVTSSDGINWTNRTRANSNPIFALTYHSNSFIAFHTNIGYNTNLTNISVTTSNDGITWTNQNTIPYFLPMARTISNTVAIGDGKLILGLNPLVDISNNYANTGTFTYEQFLTSPSFPNKISYTVTDHVNATTLAIKNTSSATVLTNTYALVQSLNVNNAIYQDFDGAVNTQIFTANGYWIKPAWANTGQELVIVNIWGGGGGGAEQDPLTANGAGGGGAAFVWGIFISSQCDSTCNVVVGQGGLVANPGENSVFYNTTGKGLYLTGYGGRPGSIVSAIQSYGGGGSGWLGTTDDYGRGTTPQRFEYGGGPISGNGSVLDSEFGGGVGSPNGGAGNTGISVYGGGGGGAMGAAGGNSFYGAGGGTTGNSEKIGVSLFLMSGNGGSTSAPATAPGGGGSGARESAITQSTDWLRGARGEVRVYTIRKIS